MTTREVAYALAVRKMSKRAKSGRAKSGRTEVLLEQRAASNTVMPGMWELPAIAPDHLPQSDPILTVRHSIMQVNYIVNVYAVSPGKISASASDPIRRWIASDTASAMALTGLARKVLAKARVLQASSSQSATIAPPAIAEVV